MKLNAHYDVEFPIAQVYAELADFDAWERAAMRRGAEISRTDTMTRPGPGATWLARFRYRSKDRSAVVRVDKLEAPTKLAFAVQSTLTDAGVLLDLLELSPKRTRLEVGVELKPKTLAAKLYVQSLKLAKSRVDRKFAARVGHFVLDLEDRIRRPKAR
jgi:hypothetical protein